MLRLEIESLSVGESETAPDSTRGSEKNHRAGSDGKSHGCHKNSCGRVKFLPNLLNKGFGVLLPRVPFIVLVGVLRIVSAVLHIIIHLIADGVVLGVALHPRDRDAPAHI